MNKAALKRLAVELREEIDVSPFDAFDPYALADLYGIDVIRLSELDCSDAARQHFHVTNAHVFSGALVPLGHGAVILENDAHAPVRRRSTAAHEMAHVVREHPFTASLVNERGCRVADPEHEAEAAELAGELLVPFEAAKRFARLSLSDEEVALRFGVSTDIARWRMNATGARIIAQRAAATRRSGG